MGRSNVSSLQLILLGAGGHASVLLSLALAAGHRVLGVCDPVLARNGVSCWKRVPVLGDDTALAGVDRSAVGLMNGVGHLVGSGARQRLFDQLVAAGFAFPVLIHPAAWVADGVKLSNGVQIMAGVIVQPDCDIRENCIVNTMASIDHGCLVGPHVHIAPGATLCGGVRVDQGAFVGAGSTVVQNANIGMNSIVGAGVVVTKDLAPNSRVIGAPSRFSSIDSSR
jgi:sugar O-acyltransferase (sialic acid O-acetyltransferase NeuD family)